MSSMISENQHLVSTLEKYQRQSLGHHKQHSVEQEVLASEDVSLGKICARCFKSAESSNISEVFLMMMRTEVLLITWWREFLQKIFLPGSASCSQISECHSLTFPPVISQCSMAGQVVDHGHSSYTLARLTPRLLQYVQQHLIAESVC